MHTTTGVKPDPVTPIESSAANGRLTAQGDEIDVLGVGFGPANLGLAIAIEEANAQLPESLRLSARFLEQNESFGWHDGMLLPETTMQISLIRPGNNGDSEATERTSLSCPKRSTPSSYANEQSAWSSTPSKLTLVPAAASSAGSATNSV
ncbi:SidA/IucD/PvdA family monooxygenase [Brevibacterium aurantiacum]|uniref:SidA/IucD/PvdA family monooxygenase n=2 Tax=Brevibacterium aurantiacum TaxID=273384 RepID=UPI000F0A0BD6|nr:SidA/IucD/PvdA family monooxygenase [Brevibacterium aurantiacum]